MKIWSYTFGCKVNQYETELLRHRMAGKSDVHAKTPAEADLCLINTCSVTAFADKEARQMIRRVLRENNKARVIVTDKVQVFGVVNATLKDITPGAFIGVGATPQADGSQRAIRIMIFADVQRGTGEGHRPWNRPGTTASRPMAFSITA